MGKRVQTFAKAGFRNTNLRSSRVEPGGKSTGHHNAYSLVEELKPNNWVTSMTDFRS